MQSTPRKQRTMTLALAAATLLGVAAPVAVNATSVAQAADAASAISSVSAKKVSDSVYNLNWTTSSNPSKGFYVERDGKDMDGDGAWGTTVSGSLRTFQFQKLVKGSTYNLTVKNNDTGEVKTARIVAGQEYTAPTTAYISAKAVQTSPSSAKIVWTDGGDKSQGFYVERDGKDSTGYGAWGTTVSGSTTEWEFKSLVAGTPYTFTVKNLATGQITKATITLTSGTVTPAPTAYTVTTTGYSATNFGFKTNGLPSGGKLVITWIRNGATQTASTTSWSWWSGDGQSGWSNAKAQVVDASGKVLATSPVVSPTTTTPTTPPPTTTPTASLTATAAMVGTSSAKLSWTETGDASKGFYVERDGVDATGYGAWGTTITSTAKTQSWQFDQLKAGSTYNLTVKNLATGKTATAKVTVPGSSTTTPPPTNTTPPPASSGWSVGKRSGLKWDQGVFAHDPNRVVRFENKVGRKVDVYQVAPQRNEGFGVMLSETKRIMGYVPADAKVDLAVPLLSYDEAKQLGQVLQSTGHGDAYVRPGWEFNMVGGGWAWSMDKIGAAAHKQGYINSINGFRAAAPGIKAEWNVNLNSGGVSRAMQAYPGDAYVDVIGVDAYDWNNESSFNDSGDLNDWLAVAKQHGKKMSLPEWGVHRGSDGNGDNPAYIRQVLTWVNNNRDTVVFASYFDETMSYIQNSIADGQVPNSAEAYRQTIAGM